MRRVLALAFFFWLSSLADAGGTYTRGVGVYPGDPAEDFAPVLAPDASYRNLALLRPAYQSSSYDYNLTAQLLTDGIKETKLPRWLVTTLSTTGVAAKNEREFLVDHNSTSNVNLKGPSGWMQFEMAGGESPLEIDRVDFEARFRPAAQPAGQSAEWTATVQVSEDGRNWTDIGSRTGPVPPPPPPILFGPTGSPVRESIRLREASRSRIFRIRLSCNAEGVWTVNEIGFFRNSKRVEPGGPHHFTSAWMSEGAGQEWVYVDLLARCTFDRVVLYWILRAAEGVLQVSDDAANWKDLQPLDPRAGLNETLNLQHPAQGRYVRVLMKAPASPQGYILSELEVYGRGGPVPRLPGKSVPLPRPDGTWNLGGCAWRLQRNSLVRADGEVLSRPGFRDADWIPATVPATVLSSYWNAGALPDPNYGSNQLVVSDSFFYADFWYRTEFTAPPLPPGRRLWLNFQGINWKADVFVNGEKLGRMEGAFTRGRFDVTGKIRPGRRNALAVRIEKNATPGSVKQKTLQTAGLNGGALGADNPTFHASIGWDWIPTVRGRNIGIWGDVYLSQSGPVTIEDPFVQSTLPLPDTSSADLRIETMLRNHGPKAVGGTLEFDFGEISVRKKVALDPGSAQMVALDPSTEPALSLRNPRLWWPAGYGDQNLYEVKLRLEIDGRDSDTRSFRAGVRQFTYSEDGGALRIWINGRRFVGRGGNWGFPEVNLRYRAREYDTAVAYHKDMNFTMIRNWVGQTGDEAFFEACDRHGVVIWQDFWLANPVDGPDPADNGLFLANVRDFVLRIRNHPSIGLYCGRNEGNPPQPIDSAIREILGQSHPGVHYISNSAWRVVSGGGPYAAQTARYYFTNRATSKLHSELGMPNIVTWDSLLQMMPRDSLWPQDLVWGLHDFNLTSAQRLASFRSVIDNSYGGADGAEEWVRLAQFVNYDGYRAIFEAQSRHRMGVLLWMSHPCWPSFVWQTYDYYFDPTAGYFGSRKGSEPLHIQWNASTDNVEVVNYSAGNLAGLSATAEILNLDGSVQWQRSAALDSAEDSVASPISLEYPAGLTPVHFLRLKLSRGGSVLSENFYWRGTEEGNYRALQTLPVADVEVSTAVERDGGEWLLRTELHNASAGPAMMLRIKAVRSASGDRILPAFYSDNYVSLMPGERRTIVTRLRDADTRGESPAIAVDGFHVRARKDGSN